MRKQKTAFEAFFLFSSLGAPEEPARAVGQIDLMMECQMEQKISGISKFSEKRTTSRG